MLAKEIKYVDFDGNERTETFYFNLTKSEMMKLEIIEEGGLTNKINRIIASKDGKEIMKLFDELVKASYGEKSPDGRLFLKSDEIYSRFVAHKAYDEFFWELCTVEGKAAEFVNAVFEQDIVNKIPGASNTTPVTPIR